MHGILCADSNYDGQTRLFKNQFVGTFLVCAQVKDAHSRKSHTRKSAEYQKRARQTKLLKQEKFIRIFEFQRPKVSQKVIKLSKAASVC